MLSSSNVNFRAVQCGLVEDRAAYLEVMMLMLGEVSILLRYMMYSTWRGTCLGSPRISVSNLTLD